MKFYQFLKFVAMIESLPSRERGLKCIGNTVTINIVRKIKAVTSQYENELMPETIPEGFRPAVDATLVINANERANIIGSAIFHLSAAGEIRMTTYITNTAVWTGTITYLTEDPMPK